MYRYTYYLVFILILLISSVAIPQIPRTLSYQGILTDHAGKPRLDQDYQFTFCLYDTAIGSTPLWSEQKTLSVKNGLFSTILGDQKPFGATVKFDKQYWLGIRVGGEAELAPRVQLTSVGYSLNALRADTAKYAQTGDGVWASSDSNIYLQKGNVGIGTANPVCKLDVKGSISGHELYLNPSSHPMEGGEIVLGPGTGDNYPEWHIDSYYRYLRFFSPDKFTVEVRPNANLTLINEKNTDVCFTMQTGDMCKWWFSGDYSTNRLLIGGTGVERPDDNGFPFVIHWNGNIGIGTLNPSSKLEVVGRTKTSVLEITGGGFDLAEQFETSHTDTLPKGSVLVIDENNPGRLKLSSKPYDQCVAGIISGAGGIQPGLTLGQEEIKHNHQQVALTGRVYALATAENGAIKPGDLLTTSQIPGHAMKATNQKKWPGAVIGKAMSSLVKGEGLVLVLVSLQ